MKIKAKRASRYPPYAEKVVEIEVSTEERAGGLVFFIKDGGVTGYESFYVDPDAVKEMKYWGWIANFGTPGKYDRMEIEAEEMNKAFEAFGL